MNGPVRVLLVDDEPDFLEITAKRLGRRGYQVQTATSCLQGIKALEAGGADVIILDVMLPETDGIECLKKIRRLFPECAVILLTGHASVQTGLSGIAEGADDYCLKPVEVEELVDKIEIARRDHGR
ncbi:MAG: response regulator [Gaiellales bacterium]|nr:MAG: response regulator [Gaiellales bacterium]